MQIVRATTATAMFMLLAALDPAYAQPGQDKDKQERRENRQERKPQGGQPPAQQHKPEARDQHQGQPRQQERAQPQQQQREQQQRQVQQQQQQRAQQQRDQQQRQIPQQQQQRAQQQDRRIQESRQSQQQGRTEQQARQWQQQRGWVKQGGWQGQTTWQQGRAERWDSEHRTWQQRGGYGGYYIPQSRFTVSFGNSHYFRMQGRPSMYMGYPRFNYGGFSFLMLDRWPEYWAENWYQDDDVYIDYDDGYYLYNRRYPRVRLAITVVL